MLRISVVTQKSTTLYNSYYCIHVWHTCWMMLCSMYYTRIFQCNTGNNCIVIYCNNHSALIQYHPTLMWCMITFMKWPQQTSINKPIFISYTMGTSGFPDVYTWSLRAAGPRAEGVYIRWIMSAYGITTM